ncbi:hypothetical protein ABZ829_27885 [Streptomyces xanthochromogenes]|uniref:hypothetical protein n=1 Tax=Streptomyces xanthochromogenes TaxID=67384 RepID=UPI003444770A
MTIGDRRVELRTSRGEKVSLRAAEHAAVRLLHALPDPAEPPAEAFGFALSSDTERAPDTAPDLEDDDE